MGWGQLRPAGLKLGVLAIALALLSCDTQRAPLRIGLNAWPGYEFLYLAEKLHLFEKHGVRVRLVEFNSLADARFAAERGSLDGLGTTVIEVLLARERSPENALSITRVVDSSHGADVILARGSSKEMSSLKGKRVGVELGSLGVYVLARALESAHLSLSDVVPVAADQATMATNLLGSKELDAIVTYPPTSVAVSASSDVVEVFSTKAIPGEVVDVLAFTDAAIKARPKDLDAVAKAFAEAIEHSKTHPEDFRIMGQREGLSEDAFQAALRDGMVVYSSDDQRQFFGATGTLRRVIRKSCQVLAETKQLSKGLSNCETGGVRE